MIAPTEGSSTPINSAAFFTVAQSPISSTVGMFTLFFAISVILSFWLYRLGHLPAYEYRLALVLLRVKRFQYQYSIIYRINRMVLYYRNNGLQGRVFWYDEMTLMRIEDATRGMWRAGSWYT